MRFRFRKLDPLHAGEVTPYSLIRKRTCSWPKAVLEEKDRREMKTMGEYPSTYSISASFHEGLKLKLFTANNL